MSEMFDGLEESDYNPYQCLRIGKIQKIIEDTKIKYTSSYRTAIIYWLDRPGISGSESCKSIQIPLTSPYMSRGSGIFTVPSIGDIVVCGFRAEGHPIILGYLPQNYWKKVTGGDDLGYIFPNIVEGELNLKSKQGAEVYLDRKGSVKVLVRDQSDTEEVEVIDSLVNLSKKEFLVQDTPQIEVTVGQVFDSTYQTEVKSTAGNPIRLKVEDYQSGTKIVIDSIGTLEITTAGKTNIVAKDDVTLALDSGKKLSVTGDSAEIVGSNSLALLSELQSLVTTFNSLVTLYNSHVHVDPQGGSVSPTVSIASSASSPSGTQKLKAS